MLSPTAWKILEGFWLSAPELSGTSSAICTGTLRNLISHLPRNPPGFHQPSAPEPSGTSSALQNPISNLHQHRRNPPESHLHRTSGTSSAICSGTVRDFISHLHPKASEPSGTFCGTWCCSCTGSHQTYSGLKTP